MDANVELSKGNELLSVYNTATFLGIALEERLTWSAQAVEQRCLKRLNALRTISGSSWGASKSNLLQVYRATIQSVMDYGCEAVVLGGEQIKNVYEKIKAHAPAICCSITHGTSTASLQVESGEPPHDLCRQKLMAYHALRSTANNNEAIYFLLYTKMMKKKQQLTPWKQSKNSFQETLSKIFRKEQTAKGGTKLFPRG